MEKDKEEVVYLDDLMDYLKEGGVYDVDKIKVTDSETGITKTYGELKKEENID